MFTGIIKDIGRIAHLQSNADGTTLMIDTQLPLGEIDIGASIACNGVCLTVERIQHNQFTVTLSPTTVTLTTFHHIKTGNFINLECSLKIGDTLDGHLVFGHVDGIGTVASIEQLGNSYQLKITCPDDFDLMLVSKGSITVNGVSLTVVDVEKTTITLTIIPHTWQHTNLQYLEQNSPVNLEADMLARYVAKNMRHIQ